MAALRAILTANFNRAWLVPGCWDFHGIIATASHAPGLTTYEPTLPSSSLAETVAILPSDGLWRSPSDFDCQCVVIRSKEGSRSPTPPGLHAVRTSASPHEALWVPHERGGANSVSRRDTDANAGERSNINGKSHRDRDARPWRARNQISSKARPAAGSAATSGTHTGPLSKTSTKTRIWR